MRRELLSRWRGDRLELGRCAASIARHPARQHAPVRLPATTLLWGARAAFSVTD
jgi:hypothetical protein